MRQFTYVISENKTKTIAIDDSEYRIIEGIVKIGKNVCSINDIKNNSGESDNEINKFIEKYNGKLINLLDNGDVQRIFGKNFIQ